MGVKSDKTKLNNGLISGHEKTNEVKCIGSILLVYSYSILILLKHNTFSDSEEHWLK